MDMELAIRMNMVGIGINVGGPAEARGIYKIEEVIEVLQFID
ncbi:hypothetical protein [Sporosarcina luteola]|nr:hypothetical protein [Sporosarcina luteola]